MNKQMRKTKQELNRFYRLLLEWVLAGMPDNEYGFNKEHGLCDNLEGYVFSDYKRDGCTFAMYVAKYDDLYKVQRKLFDDYLGYTKDTPVINRSTPFNASLSAYADEAGRGLCFANKDRLAFIVNQVVSKPLQEAIKLSADLNKQAEEEGRRASGICAKIMFYMDPTMFKLTDELKRWFDRVYHSTHFPFEDNTEEGRQKYWNDQNDRILYKNPARLHFIEVMTSAVREA